MQCVAKVVVLHNREGLDYLPVKRLVAAVRAKGVPCEQVYAPHVSGHYGESDAPGSFHAGSIRTDDIVFTRIVGDEYSRRIAWFLHYAGVKVVNNPLSAHAAGDKMYGGVVLSRAGFPVTPTDYFHSLSDYQGSVSPLIGMVAKTPRGMSGTNVRRVTGAGTINEVAEDGSGVLLQPFLPFNDVRALVVGGCYVTAMTREPAPGDFRANLSKGAVGHPIELPSWVEQLTVDVVSLLGLFVAGVDLLVSDDFSKLYVGEVNPTPGLRVEQVTGVDVVERIAEGLAGLAAGKPRTLA